MTLLYTVLNGKNIYESSHYKKSIVDIFNCLDQAKIQ